MEVLKDKHQRWGLISTLLFHVLLFLLFLLFGLKTPVPIPSENIVINFGTSAEGSGEVQPKEPAESPSPTEAVETKPVTSSAPTKTEAVTQDNTEAPSVTDKKTEKPKEPEKEPEREVNQKALYPGKKSSTSQSSEGETGKPGDQGDVSGSKDASSHVGGNSGGDSYSLGNRKAVDKVKPRYDCPESGRVVVKIQVDKQGNVVNATPGARGTTNSADCLYRKAVEAALKTKWDLDANAPEVQNGEIIYNFQLK